MKRKKILFICTGNTCRSPMAEVLLRAEIKKRKIKFIDVASAGLKVTKGSTINPLSEQTLQEHGLTVSPKFKSRQLTDKIYQGAFVVIAMTSEMKNRLPQEQKVYSVAELTGEDIPDPYGQGKAEYEKTFLLLQKAMERIAGELLPTKK